MARLVEHDETGPVRIDESDIDPEWGDIAVCQCGLSDERPFCDGSHKAADGEGEDLYVYEDGERKRVEEIVVAED